MSFHTIRMLPACAAALAALLALSAAPAKAQVDWSIIQGTSNQAACPNGKTQSTNRGTAFDVEDNSVTVSEVRIRTTTFTLSYLRNALRNQGLPSVGVAIDLIENGGGKRTITLGTAMTGTDVAGTTTPISNLKAGTSYAVELKLNGRTSFTDCFRTAPDLNIPFGSGRAVGPGDSWSSGCFAFGGTRQQILACLCGARNSSGQWARTDSEDGYNHIIPDSTWRTSVGCQTN